jgi:hypothetical protein
MKQWHEITCVTLDKVATISKPLGNGCAAIWMVKHSELAAALEGETAVTFDYCYGKEKRRLKQIDELGFTLTRTIWRNTDAKHARIKQIYFRFDMELTDEDVSEWQGRY